MSGTNVPSPAFSDSGFLAPAESAILAGTTADIDSAFGGGLNPALNTPQGQIASSIAAIVGDKNDQFLQYIANVDPATSAGRMQDGIARIYFITRNPAQPTTVQVTCSGLTGVAIPVGALVSDTAGNIYSCTEAGTIGSSGSIILPFACRINGPIVCAAGSINTAPYQAIPGWDTAANATDGVLGNLVESRSAFELRRQQSVAKNGTGSLPSVLGAVLAVPNVLDAYVTENTTSTPVTVGGVTILDHSIYVAVAGGDADAIAQAIWTKKSPGANYTGNTTVSVSDTSYSVPYPSYPVSFETPTPTPVFFSVMIANSSSVPSTALQQIQAAIAAAFSGADGGPRARIASTVFASRYYAGIALLGAWAQVVSIQIGLSTANQNSITLGINQVPTVAPSDVTLTLV